MASKEVEDYIKNKDKKLAQIDQLIIDFKKIIEGFKNLKVYKIEQREIE